jgi:hypothetical protein
MADSDSGSGTKWWDSLDIQPADQTRGQPATVPPAPPQGAQPSAMEAALDTPTSTPPTDPALPFLSRSWRTLYGAGADLVADLKRDLTPTFAMPGSAPSTPAPGLAANTPPGVSTDIYSPGAAGVARGVKDVALSQPALWALGQAENVTGTDLADRLGKYNEADRQQFERDYGNSNWASVGRIGGQFAATAPLLGPIRLGLQAGAEALPGVLGAVSRFATGAAPASSIAGRGVQLGSEGALAGAGFGALTSGQSDESLGTQAGQGAIGGAVLGPLVGAGTGLVRALTGVAGGIDPAVARLAQTAQDQFGLTIPITKMSTNPTMRILSDQFSKLPFSGAFSADQALRRQAQGVLAGEMGETANNIGPEVMGAARDRISKGFTDWTNSVPQISAGPFDANGNSTLAKDLSDIGTQAVQIPLPKDSLDIVGQQIRNIGDAFAAPGTPKGQISPEGFLALTAQDGPLQRAYNAAPSAAKPYIAGMQDALHDRLAASLPPDQQAALQQLRYQWRVMKTLEGAQTPAGDMSFDRFGSAVANASKQYDPMAQQYAYNADPNNTLNMMGRIGRQFLGGLPDSGTAARATASSIPALISGLATSIGTAPLTALMRSPWVSRNAIAASLGQPLGLLGSAVPSVERTLLPSVALGAGLREQARRQGQ